MFQKYTSASSERTNGVPALAKRCFPPSQAKMSHRWPGGGRIETTTESVVLVATSDRSMGAQPAMYVGVFSFKSSIFF